MTSVRTRQLALSCNNLQLSCLDKNITKHFELVKKYEELITTIKINRADNESSIHLIMNDIELENPGRMKTKNTTHENY